MNVLQKRPPALWEDQIRNVYQILKLPDIPLELKGSASLQSQRYFSDYDFFCFVPKMSPTQIYQTFTSIRDRLFESENIFPIETKIQKGNKKYRFYKNNPLRKSACVDPDLIKIDIVVRVQGNDFTEVSCIYSFRDEFTEEERIEQIEDEFRDLMKEKNYYKALKRLFSIFRAQKDSKQLVRLTRFFNGPNGLLYQKISSIEALEKLQEYYKEELKRIQFSLNDLGISQVEKEKRLYLDTINKAAKKILNDINKTQ